MTSVLVVEDEPVVRDVVVRYLREAGFATSEAPDGLEAQRMLTAETPGLVILDVMLPGLDGLELCRWLRARDPVPIIMLTARGEEADRIVGLELGADDYVTKPFSPRELVARTRSVLRRTETAGPSSGERLVFGELSIDPSTRDVVRAGRDVKLTAREFDLLWLLAAGPRRVFTREQLMDLVWGYGKAKDTGTLTVHIRRLREKIEEDASHPSHIETVWGVGYRFVP
ncbi:MAG: response regulator transcription factor [Actinomycetota bacterium]